MKTILRNFLSVLRRFKMATFLNVAGLAVAFTAFMVIMMQVIYDYTFDSCQPEADAIYRMNLEYNGELSAPFSRPFARGFTESSPLIKAGMIMSSWNSEMFYSVERDGERQSFQDPVVFVTPEATRVFRFEMVEGDETALDQPETAMIPESMARRLFGNETAIGKRLMDTESGATMATINGVFKDFPRNSSIQNIIYRQMSPKENYDAWRDRSYFFFFRLDDPANLENVKANFKKNFDATQQFGKDFDWEKSGVDLRCSSLPELHFQTNISYDSMPKASRQTMSVLFAIAFVILLIAGINFTNFSTALTPMRIKSINTQKVLGSSDDVLRFSLQMEAVCISVIAYLLALGLVYYLGISPLAELVNADMSLSVHPLLLSVTALIAVLVGVLAGVYPAYYMTSFPPALVLKGSFGLSPKGRVLRNVLISVQFVASFALIIGAMFMYLQNYFMSNSPLGYEKDQIIVTNLTQSVKNSKGAFVNQLKSYSGIEDVTFAEMLLSSQDQFMGWGRDLKGENIEYQCLPVDASFLNVMGVKVNEGRGFRNEDELTQKGVYIFNERAKEVYDIKLGDHIEGSEIIGFMPDVKFASFRTEVTPMAFYLWGQENWGSGPAFAYIKVKAGSDMRGALQEVKDVLKTIDPDYPFNVRFYDEVMNAVYVKEKSLSTLISLFSLIAVFISIVGVFGLVVFESQYRRKEIGVRKVMGSTTSQILIMFNKTYFRILVICFVLAAPLAYFAISRWLENFAYKTPMYWWVFVIAFILVSFITLLTVTFQNLRTASENPVKSIKTE